MNQDFIRKLQARKAAVKHGHPSRAVELVAITGYGSETTAQILSEIFRESGKKTAVFTPRGSWIESIPYTPPHRGSAEELQRALAAAKKQHCNIVIITIDTELEQTGAIDTLNIDLALVTDADSASQAVLGQPLRYMVVPTDTDANLEKVAPHHVITYGDNISADARLESVKLFRRGTELNLVIDHQTHVNLATYLIGHTNARRITAAVAAAYVMGAPVEDLPEGVARLESVIGNFQFIDLDLPYRVAVDDAATTSAVQSVVESARAITRRRVLVICDQSVDPDALSAIRPSVDRLVVISGHSGEATDVVDSLAEAVQITMRGAKMDDMVLLIGEELAEQIDEERTRGERLVRGENE